MTQSKSWYQSKTIWGILIAAGGFVATQYFQIPVEAPENADFEQLKAHVEAVKAANSNIAVIISEVVAAIGTVLAIVGRVKADNTIS